MAASKSVNDRYRKFVLDNKESLSQIESTVRVLSYLIAGRFEESDVLSELIYCASNLLVLLNDSIIRGANNLHKNKSLEVRRLNTWLAVFDYSEVFLELAAYRLWKNPGKWIIVTCIQLIKVVIQFFLLLCHNSGIQTTPPVVPLNRGKEYLPKQDDDIHDMQSSNQYGREAGAGEPNQCMTLTLQRSGRTIRKLSAAPPMNYRTWKLQEMPDNKTSSTMPMPITKKRLIAESIHITRPIVHLLSMYLFGEKMWKPWLIASATDVASLYMMGDIKQLTQVEQDEITRRQIIMLYYLLRSPFYDRFSKMQILNVLKFLSKIPGASIIIEPLLQYLPVWQNIYFYVWAA